MTCRIVQKQVYLIVIFVVFVTAATTAKALPRSSSSHPTSVDIMQSVIKDYQKAQDFYDQGKNFQALQLFLRALHNLPQETRFAYTRNELRFFIGRCYYHLGMYPQAQTMLRYYIEHGARDEVIEEVRRMWGDEAAAAARAHIVSDLKLEGWTEADRFPRDEADYVRMGLF